MAFHTDAIEAKAADFRRRELPIELLDHEVHGRAGGVADDADDDGRVIGKTVVDLIPRRPDLIDRIEDEILVKAVPIAPR